MLSCRGMRDGLDGIRAALATIPEGELTALQATADESPHLAPGGRTITLCRCAAQSPAKNALDHMLRVPDCCLDRVRHSLFVSGSARALIRSRIASSRAWMSAWIDSVLIGPPSAPCAPAHTFPSISVAQTCSRTTCTRRPEA